MGLTTYPPEFRLKSHVNEAINGGKRRIHKWIRSLPSVPAIIILERDPPDLKLAECGWISFLRMEGARLVNGTDGGDGLLNPSFEVREKLSSWQIGRKMSAEAKGKMSVSQRRRFTTQPGPMVGKKHSEKAKAKIRERRASQIIIHSEEFRKKTSTRLKKFWSEISNERKTDIAQKISRSNLGRIPWNKGLHTGNQYTRTKEKQNV